MSFLELNALRKQFGSSAAVEEFDLQAERGEFVSLLGPSGCGKTTTLRMIAGFEQPTSGSIRLAGVDIGNRPPNRRNIGMVFQSYALFPNMTVGKNIGFGLAVRKEPREQIRQRVDELLDLINLTEKKNRYPHELSGGQQQRVALARALAIRPQLLLLDEPLSALDAKIRVRLRTEIRDIQRRLGITTVYVTHDQEEALSLSDRVVVMNGGRIEQIGSPFDVYNLPKTGFVAKFVGTLSVLDAKVVGGGVLDVGGQLIRLGESAGTHLGIGENVAVALRPEILSLNAGPADVNHLQGVVDDITFLGSIVRLRLRLPGAAGQVVFDTFNNHRLSLPELNATAQVHFSPDACLVLERSALPSWRDVEREPLL